MKNTVIALLTAILLSSCAAIEPPRIENDTYINPRYEYSINVPSGWMPTEKIPPWMENDLPLSIKDKISIMFFNNQTSGMIMIIDDKSIFDFRKLTRSQVRAVIEKGLKSEEEKSRKNPYIKYFSFKIYPYFPTVKPGTIATFEERMENEFIRFEAAGNLFLYSCREDDTCSVSIALISLTHTFEENKADYENMLQTLERYHVSAQKNP